MIKKILLEKLITVIWPWFKKNIWPIIVTKFLEIIPSLFDWFIQKIKDLFNSNNQNRQAEAEVKSNVAKEKAEQAKTNEEAAIWKKEAEIWREVADQYKNDNTTLKEQLSKIQTEAQSEISDEINKIDPEIKIQSGNLIFQLNDQDQNTNLPKLE